jgi:hypothetical protein
MASEIKGLKVVIGAEIDKVKKAFADVERATKPLAASFTSLGTAMTKGVTVPVAAAAAAIGGLVTTTANYADEIDKMSIRTGISTDTLQEMRYVADQVGVQFSSLTMGVTQLTRRLVEGGETSKITSDAMKSLGLTIRTASGAMKDQETIFFDTARALSRIRNETQRTALAMQLFGRQGVELLPMLSQGEESMDKMRDRARELGLVMSGDAIAGFVDFKDAWAEAKMAMGAAFRELATNLLPVLRDEFIPFLREKAIPAMREIGLRVADAARFFADLPGPVKATSLAFIGLAAAMGPVLLTMGALVAMAPGLVVLLGPLGIAGAIVALGIAAAAGASRMSGLTREMQSQARAAHDLARANNALTGAQAQARLRELGLERIGINRQIIETEKEVAKWQEIAANNARRGAGDGGTSRMIEDNKAKLAALRSQLSGVNQETGQLARNLVAINSDGPDTVVNTVAGSEPAQRRLKAFRVEMASVNNEWARMARLMMRIRNMKEGADAVNFRTMGVSIAGLDEDAVNRNREAVERLDEAWKSMAGTAQVFGAYVGTTLQGVAMRFADEFGAAVYNIVAGFDSLKDIGSILTDIFRRLVAQLVAAAAQALVLSGIMTAFGMGGAGFGGLFLNAMGFGGFRAAGGPVRSGMSYLVGERGPELFTPGASGAITPNHALGGMQIQVTGRLVAEGNELVAVIDRAERRNRVIGI